VIFAEKSSAKVHKNGVSATPKLGKIWKIIAEFNERDFLGKLGKILTFAP
jgi:hypothetical protein